MNIFLVGIGGILGSLTRYQLGKALTQRTGSAFPLGTVAVNISGAFLLGLLTGVKIDRTLFLLLCDGYLGAYTTFSTFMYEGFDLFRDNEKLNASIYIAGTMILGLAGCFAGYELGSFISL